MIVVDAPATDVRSRWRRLRDLIRLYATWKQAVVPAQSRDAGRRPARSRIRVSNRNVYQNGVIKRWANSRGKTAATVPILTQTKRHYRQLFAMLDRQTTGYVHADDLTEAARQCQIDLSRDQARAMIANYDDNHDDSVDFNEFQNLMDRDIRSLDDRELSSGHPLMFFMIVWQRRTLMSRLMEKMALTPDDVRILKQTRRLAAEIRDREAAEQVDRYWKDQVKNARLNRPDDDDALRQIDGAEQHAFRRLHERLYKNRTFRRFRDPNRITLLEVRARFRISNRLLGLYGYDQQPR